MNDVVYPRPYRITCEGCGIVGEFDTPDAAFEAGWDAPPQFTVVTCCPNCSAAEILIARSQRVNSIDEADLRSLAQAMIEAGHARVTPHQPTIEPSDCGGNPCFRLKPKTSH